MKSILEIDKSRCFGCGLCQEVCHKQAIIMVYEDGFLCPKVNPDLCVSCGKCLDECQIFKTVALQSIKKAYIAVAKDESIYQYSSSGGVFGIMAHYFVEELHGVVIGASIDEGCNVKHIVVDRPEDIKKIQGSKYVQSDISGLYPEIRQLINKGLVLFCGTPCQVAAIKSLFGDSKNLFLIDLVCHGVPSPELFKEHVTKNLIPGDKIKNIAFRTKDKFDRYGFNLLIETEKRKKLVAGSIDPYYRLFLNNITFRECCYSCSYASARRVGDITISDCGNSEYYLEWESEKTISTVYPITEKGQKVWDILSDRFKIKEANIEFEVDANEQLNRPSDRPLFRSKRGIECKAEELEKFADEKLGQVTIKHRLKERLKRIIPEKTRRKAIKIIRKSKK